ncbi:MAG: alpha-amylase family glycosyl hydrolase, partial [Planctomycetota bacterium]
MSLAATPQVQQQGMGAIPHENGVAFRVWAPNADAVYLIGDFNDWNPEAVPMQRDAGGNWSADVAKATIGDQYKYRICNGDRELVRIDPYARAVTNSIGNSIVHDPHFDWQDDDFALPPWNELVIYEMHLGTFNRSQKDHVGTFHDAMKKFDHLQALGVNVLQLMPAAEFAGDQSWGYNPAHIFAVESAYGGPIAFKEFVREAHRRGFGVILDVVYNHFGPSDLDLWQFDGWSENGKGGIYFYNDWRSHTPWGDSRPDYGRGEVRQFIRDNALMWLDEYRLDGLRYDMTLYMRSVNGQDNLPEGWSLAQWINREIRTRFPGKITIAEDLQKNDFITKPEEFGGANFSTQWDAAFVHPIRDVLQQPDDASRDIYKAASAIGHRYNIDAFERVIYTESHDEVANGKSRVPSEINPEDAGDAFAKQRSTLGAGLVFTSPGIPMIFQGQEFLESDWFKDDEVLEWHRKEEFAGVGRLYRDLIHLRRNIERKTAGLIGQNVRVHHANDLDKLLAFHRWSEGGPLDDVVVIANFANTRHRDYRIGFPQSGLWKLRFNSGAAIYGAELRGDTLQEIRTVDQPHDGYP